MKLRRCAIYTRKSTEEGLEQAFNSLDAQREACAAFVLSQAHEGWEALPESYDDGGWSGGTIERPALKQLLADVEAGKVDVIVVYKVDRLTRSLADFARIVDTLDRAGASFVSVTQAFNTTNSMGRLTLNVLLSFAQFEREVTSERIRDKIAASKRKGMWMGGPVPLGYRLENRRLLLDDSEAATVRMLFDRYIVVRSIARLVDELAEAGVRTKVRHHANGRTVGGVPFTRGSLSQLLQNPIYQGKVHHRGDLHEGEHEGLVDATTWHEVQRILEQNRRERRNGSTVRCPSLLTGMLTDPDGRPMTPVFTSKGPRRHHYYVSRLKPGEDRGTAWRVPAGEVDRAVLHIVAQQLRSPERLAGLNVEDIEDQGALAADLQTRPVPAQRDMLTRMGASVELFEDQLLVRFADDGKPVIAALPVRLVHRGQEKRIILHGQDTTSPDPVLIRLVAHALSLRSAALQGKADDLTEGYSKRHRWQLLRIAFLAPDIIAAIVEGRQPPSLTGRRLLRATDIPLDWAAQRRFLGFS